MQRRKHPSHARTTHFIPVAAFGTTMLGVALLGCSSEHLLGDLPGSASENVPENAPGDTAGNAGETGYPADGQEDFLLSAELSPPDLRLERIETASASPEMVVTGLGDLDGDGFDDFATYSFNDNDLLSNVHIRYGRPRPERTAETFEWAESGGRLAIEWQRDTLRLIDSVRPLGDLDADGYADIFVGTSRCDQREQLAFVVYGSPQRLSGVSLLEEAAAVLKGPRIPGQEWACGGSSSTVASGDFNGDGFDDFTLLDADHVVYTRDGRGIAERYTGGTYLFYGGPHRIVSGTSWPQADVKIRASESAWPIAMGDLDGNGLADLMLREYDDKTDTFRLYWLPGQAQKLPPQVPLEGTEVATGIRGAETAGDLDGDGMNELLLYGEDNSAHLFYGHAGMMEAPIALADADASFVPYPEMAPYSELTAVPDRDGDGDDELLSSLWLLDAPSNANLLALLSGSSERLSGVTPLLEPSNPLRELSSLVERVYPVGDLDGDGASDLLTLAPDALRLTYDENGELQLPPSEDSAAWRPYPTFSLHVHFGTPGGNAAQPVR